MQLELIKSCLNIRKLSLILMEIPSVVVIVILGIVLGLQAVHIGAGWCIYHFAVYFDTNYPSVGGRVDTVRYEVAYILVAASLTALAYIYALVVKLAGLNLSIKVDFAIYFSVTLLQFALGVLIAFDISQASDPRLAANAAFAAISQYTNYYYLTLADTVLVFILAFPGSILLFLIKVKQMVQNGSADHARVGNEVTKLGTSVNLDQENALK